MTDSVGTISQIVDEGAPAEDRRKHTYTALRWQSPAWEQRPLKESLMIEIRFEVSSYCCADPK
jgi:hypothetical protein